MTTPANPTDIVIRDAVPADGRHQTRRYVTRGGRYIGSVYHDARWAGRHEAFGIDDVIIGEFCAVNPADSFARAVRAIVAAASAAY